jgi:hypothetical protein
MSSNSQIRRLVGRPVRVRTDCRTIDAVLLSCTTRSLWLLDGDVDLLVDCTHVVDVAASA